MATIRKTIDVNADIEKVWAKISNVGEISTLIGFLDDSKLVGDGRVCTLNGGGTLKEDIISVDPGLHRVVYSISKSPLNMSFHSASMELTPTETGTSLTWTHDLKPDEASEHLEPMLDMACKDMATTLLS